MEDNREDDAKYFRRKLEEFLKENKHSKAKVTISDKSNGDIQDFHVAPNEFHHRNLDLMEHFQEDTPKRLIPMELVHKALIGAKYDTIIDAKDNGFTIRGNAQELADAIRLNTVIKNHEKFGNRVKPAADRNAASRAASIQL